MAAIPNEKESEAFAYLSGIGCCQRCCLRFVGVRTQGFYQEPAVGAKTLGYVYRRDDERDSKASEEDPCTACLGVLQDATLEAAIEKIAAEVKREAYDCDTFVCALTIPIAAQLREWSIRINLSQKFMAAGGGDPGLMPTVPHIKDVWKWIALPKVEKLIDKTVDPIAPTCSFVIDVFLGYSQDEEECKTLLSMCGNTFKVRSHQTRKYSDGVFSRKSVEAALIDTKEEQFTNHYPCPPLPPKTSTVVEKVTCAHASIFIGGRYNKYSRELSQTPWFINGEKKMETSVQELLCDAIVRFVRADSLKFLSSGREDVDVRTLQSGRPFAVELLNPRITNISEKSLMDLRSRINDSTTVVKIVNQLKLVTKAQLRKLKEGEDTKTKMYRALCICRTQPTNSLAVLNNTKDLEIIQKTPVRVLHRRPLACRPRTVHFMKARWIKPDEVKILKGESNSLEDVGSVDDDTGSLTNANETMTNLFLLDLRTQAGTYVKEFVHGDFGRTNPNICEMLGAEVDIIALDVTSIDLDWP